MLIFSGAGEGNRTLVVSLGSFCSAIELHPRANDLAVAESAFIPVFYSGPRFGPFACPPAVRQRSTFRVARRP